MTIAVLQVSDLKAKFNRLGGIALLTAILSACGNPAPDSDPLPTTIPIALQGNHAVIIARINGKPAKLMLDTGADQNVLTVQAAARLGLTLSVDTVPGHGAGGDYDAHWTHFKQLNIGAAQQENQIAVVVPLPREFTADGVLGTPFFRAFVATIDYQHQRLVLQSRRHFVPPANTAGIPAKVESGKMLVRASAAGVDGWYVIDTGAANTLTFFTPTVEQYGLRDSLHPAIRTVTGVGAGGRTTGDLVRIPELLLGLYRFTGVVSELSLAQTGVFADPHHAGNLGGELWRRFSVTLDYANNHLYLEPNDALAQPFTPPRAGLAVAFEEDGLHIIDVVTPSPAADASIDVSDIVLKVDGIDVAEVSPYGLRATLEQAPGTAVLLRLRNAIGTERDATLMLRDLL